MFVIEFTFTGTPVRPLPFPVNTPLITDIELPVSVLESKNIGTELEFPLPLQTPA